MSDNPTPASDEAGRQIREMLLALDAGGFLSVSDKQLIAKNVRALQDDNERLRDENTKLLGWIKDAEGAAGRLEKERDELKAANAAQQVKLDAAERAIREAPHDNDCAAQIKYEQAVRKWQAGDQLKWEFPQQDENFCDCWKREALEHFND